MHPSPFSLAAGISAIDPETSAVEDHWPQLELPHLVIGEADLLPHPLRTRVPEVATNTDDQPCLRDLLQQAAKLPSPWILFCTDDLHFGPDMAANLAQLCRQEGQRQLITGRAFHCPRTTDPSTLTEPDDVLDAIDRYGVLDPLEQPSWALIPRGLLLDAPADVGCSRAQMLPWIVAAAHQLGWPWLEATPVAPCLRSEHHQPIPCIGRPTAVALPHIAEAPCLSLLLAAPEQQLEPLQRHLRPEAPLPWEVITRPAEVGVTTAWRDALTQARGELCWPLLPPLPPLAMLPVLLEAFDRPGVDVVQLGWSLNGTQRPGDDPLHQEPGCLVAHTAWWKRLLDNHGPEHDAATPQEWLLQLRQQAQARGAGCLSLPLVARAR